VTPAVLIPRPDSETLIETALKEFGRDGAKRILDLGTGSGCLIVALLAEWRRATAIAVDASADALAVAARNAARHDVASRVEFRVGDWAAGIDERFDLVISNPPYISEATFATLDADVRAYEPASALKAGPRGLDAIARIAKSLGAILKPSALALIEIGHDQGQQAKEILTKNGLERARIVKDLAGHDRVVVAGLPQ
jgi:release factor glutamine methyltransferase